MSCPDWVDLVRGRDRSGEDQPAWGQALAHLEQCAECRHLAVAADPLLAFRRLPLPTTSATQVDVMRQGVHAILRSQRLERAAPDSRPVWWSVAAAAVVVLVVTLGPARPEPEVQVASPQTAAPVTPAEPALDLTSILPTALVDVVDRPRARVYEIRQQDLAVVMIVDETLDV